MRIFTVCDRLPEPFAIERPVPCLELPSDDTLLSPSTELIGMSLHAVRNVMFMAVSRESALPGVLTGNARRRYGQCALVSPESRGSTGESG